MICVPNKFPAHTSARKLALIGEAPGSDEEKKGEPFVGASGRFLSQLLSQAGLSRESCFLGNISQVRPANNDFTNLSWDGPEVQQGMETLTKDLQRFQPNLVVLLGNVPLKAAKDPSGQGPIRKFTHSNAKWRGSLFCADGTSPFAGLKCLSTLHPAFVLRDYGSTPLLMFDLKKAARESLSPDLKTIERLISVPKTVDEALAALSYLNTQRTALGTDIEGYLRRLQCIAFADDPTRAFVLPFLFRSGRAYWEPADELRIWRALTGLLENPSVPKIWQNGLYDRFVFHYGHGIVVRNNIDDIMLKHWELNSELSKGENNADKRKAGMNLAIQTSIYTNEPYYKGDYKSEDDHIFWRYNGMDACVTKEISNVLSTFLTADCSKRHYRMNVKLLNPLLYMELRGMCYNKAAADVRRKLLQRQLYARQAELNQLTGSGFQWKTIDEIRTHIITTMMTKKGDRPLKKYAEQYYQVQHLLQQTNPTIATIGEIEQCCGKGLNTGSNDQMVEYLYGTLCLPTQWKENKDKEKPPTKTADYEALIKLTRLPEVTSDENRKRLISLCIEIRSLETRQRMLSIGADEDGRIRCGYNIVGSNTGRISCYESPTGSGYNLQTIPNYTRTEDAPGAVLGDRDLFTADEGFWFFQCDLKGADGWTVAAYCAMLGDNTMLDDYRYGLKPYLILCAMLRGIPGIDYGDRASIKEACRKIDKDSWDAFASKRVQHGGAYGEGDITISRSVLKDSEGKLYLPPKECGKLKDFYHKRYPGIRKWHAWTMSTLKQQNHRLVAASGQIREFFGRHDELMTKAVAFEPQANTTFAIALALDKLWHDKENRYEQGTNETGYSNDEPTIPNSVIGPEPRLSKLNGPAPLTHSMANWTGIHATIRRSYTLPALRVEPLHTVHDSLNGQFKKTDTSWSVGKIRGYFQNTLRIAGQEIVIPFDGGYGPNWGCLNEGTI